MACLGLAWVATQHERSALEAEVEKRGRALAASLAGAAKEPLLGVEQGDFDGELVLERLMREVGAGNGVVAVRLLGREGRVVASLDALERGQSPKALTGAEARPAADRQGSLLLAAAPILYSKLRVGEAQVVLDLRVLVDPVVKSNTRQLALAATVVTLVGVAAGVVFVALLVGPLRRLRLRRRIRSCQGRQQTPGCG